VTGGEEVLDLEELGLLARRGEDVIREFVCACRSMADIERRKLA
jgi:hypothetical protein